MYCFKTVVFNSGPVDPCSAHLACLSYLTHLIQVISSLEETLWTQLEGVFTSGKSASSLVLVPTKYNSYLFIYLFMFIFWVWFAFTLPFLQVYQKLKKKKHMCTKIIHSLIGSSFQQCQSSFGCGQCFLRSLFCSSRLHLIN